MPDPSAPPSDVPAKRADTDAPILDVLAARWSPRAFADRPVAPDALRRLLEAARWAPSSYNEQPWRYLLATKDDPEAYERLLSGLKKKNRRWARTAPVLMVSVVRTHFSHNNAENRHAWHDVGLSAGNLTTQATALGLHVHQMAGILPEHLRDRYALPDTFEPVAGFAIGYLGDPERLPEELRKRERAPRTRRPLAETVFTDAWDEPARVVAEE